ncbi:MAG: redox-regulated ATPase YchF [Chloroflexi bacterium]|nr:MAG: redox-regulated ATPase YchF [Chloroflexota bacterium]MBL1192935.1 redox-regulated ATPase YchF [Chloroflexota bacterium]NOH10227.1 redox-regulated ATPase YchF [Chloroflexota bacterium]
MKLGIIGLPQAGKTTLYNALTGGNQPTTMSAGRIEVNTAVVDVPDPRVDRLSEIYKPKKTTYAKVTYADIAGLEGKAASGGLSGQLINELAAMEGFLHVVRCFEDDNVPHVAESLDPARDISSMDAELLLNDLIIVERKLERLAEERGKGGRSKDDIERERVLFERLQAHLSEDQPLRTMQVTADERKAVSMYGFLTLKPVLVVLNLGEGQAEPDVSAVTPHADSVGVQGALEMEIAQLPPDEAAVFLEEYGIEEPSLHRMIRLSYDLMGLQSFFTVGEDEVRAWTVRSGATAPEAAGIIHTDLQKGFIRAEIVPFDVLDELGSFAGARDAGKLRVEGKDYIVQEGEIMHVRFNV